METSLQVQESNEVYAPPELICGDNDYSYLVSDLSGYTDEATAKGINTLVGSMLKGVSGDTSGLEDRMKSYVDSTGKKYGESLYNEKKEAIEFAAETNGDDIKLKGLIFDTDLGKDLKNLTGNQAKIGLLENLMADPSARYEMIESMRADLNNQLTGAQNYLAPNSLRAVELIEEAELQLEQLDEFNKQFREKIIEHQEEIGETDVQYLVRGAILQCSEGTNIRAINMPKSHGWYFFEKPLMIKTDNVGEGNSYYNIVNNQKKGDDDNITDLLDPTVNIRSFGHCKSPEFETYAVAAGRNKIRVEQNMNWSSNGVSTKSVEQSGKGYVCEPKFTECWKLFFKDVSCEGEKSNPKNVPASEIPEDKQLITTRSYLQCVNGKGVVIPKTSGQVDTSIYGNAADSNIHPINTKQNYEYNNYNLTSSLNPTDHPEGYTNTMKQHLEHVGLHNQYKKDKLLYDAYGREGYIPDDVKQAFKESEAALNEFKETHNIERPFYTNPDYKDVSSGQLTHEIKGQSVFAWEQAIKKDPTLENSKAYRDFCEAAFGNRYISIDEAKKIIKSEQSAYYETR